MGPALRIRWVLPLVAALVIMIAAPASGRAALSIKVVGNHFVDGSGRTIRLLGVNHTSSEYGCVDGFGYDDGHFDNADAAAIASWHANAVRIPLNEDCWLGINGQPNSSKGAQSAADAAGYQQEIKNYVADLNAHGIYAILDLHWTAPGGQVALEQQPMPDADHSPAFWARCDGVQGQPGGRLRPVQRAVRPDRPEVRRRPGPDRQGQLELLGDRNAARA